MALKITLSDTVRVKVAGTIAGPEGPEPFDFNFTAKRLDSDEIARILRSDDQTVGEFLASVITHWQGVKGASGEVPYSTDALQQLLRIPGVGSIMFESYLTDCGAKRKN